MQVLPSLLLSHIDRRLCNTFKRSLISVHIKYFSTILDMVKRREQSKKDVLQITVDIFDFRYVQCTFHKCMPLQ